MYRVVLVAALASSQLSGCGLSKSCTDRGCPISVRLVLPVADTAALDGATLVLCRAQDSGTQCREVILPAMPAAAETGESVWFAGGQRAFATTWNRGGLGAEIEISMDLARDVVPAPDVHTAEVRDANDAVITQAAYDVTYRRVYPNGEDCDDGCVLGDAVQIP